MADREQVGKSEEFKRILDDNDLTSWWDSFVICWSNRIVCDIEGYSKLIVNSAGEGGYDECIKHLDSKKVNDIGVCDF